MACRGEGVSPCVLVQPGRPARVGSVRHVPHSADDAPLEALEPAPVLKANGRLPLYLLWSPMPQDEDEHAATLAIIAAAQKSNPRRLLEVIADAANLLQAKGYCQSALERDPGSASNRDPCGQ
jgi:hypothetical protein